MTTTQRAAEARKTMHAIQAWAKQHRHKHEAVNTETKGRQFVRKHGLNARLASWKYAFLKGIQL